MSKNSQAERSFPRVKIGVSSCLLGQEVRYNGGHKRDRFLISSLSQFVDYVPICPEVAIGLGVPRPPIRLVGDPDAPKAVGTDDHTIDVTARLQSFAREKTQTLVDISGYILKKDSPSCGMERVKVYSEKGGAAQRKGQGVFARVLMERMPLLPVEEEGRLNDPVLKENFLTRVFVFHRWQRLVAEGLSSRALIAFHTDHKFLLMAHSQAAYQRMGRMLADLGDVDLEAVALMYATEMMTALARRATRKRHANTLQHMAGYLKRSIDSEDKQELNHNIDAYRRGQVPLIVPITLFRHYFRRHPDPYMERQVYLHPHPEELSLRNSI
jgi:uncharacterized protein YbgA (DUF1722 family)/uncharacterized protein YbbK (DUF523 family)